MKNTRNKLLAVIVLVFLFLPIFFSFSVIAEEVVSGDIYYEGTADIMNPSANPRFLPEIVLFGSRYSDSQNSALLRDFLAERFLNIEQYKNEFTLTEHRFSGLEASDVLLLDMSKFKGFPLNYTQENISVLAEAVNDLMNKSPGLFWCKGQYIYVPEVQGGVLKIAKIGLRLNCNENFNVSSGLNPVIAKVNSLTDEFDSYVQSITGLIPDDYSDYEKILFVNDYLCADFKYDTSVYINSNSAIYDAFNFFKEGKGVCQAYTSAFMAIMDELGIRCDSVISKSMNHTWNLVELDGKWYHVDVTWNDPVIGNCENDTFGSARHKYFLLSTECITDAVHNHYGFNIENYGYKIGTEYDQINVNTDRSLKSSFVELNGVWYNTGYNSSNYTCGLYAFDSPDISDISDQDFQARAIYSINDWEYMGSYSYLAKYNDAVFFNTADSIYMFDGNKVTKLYTPPKEFYEKIYGFDIKDNTIRIQLAESPNSSDMMYATLITVNLSDLIDDEVSIKNYVEKNGQVTIYSSLNKEATLIFASYDKDNRMIDCKTKVYSGITKITSGTRKYTAPADLNTNGADKITVMLLENTNSLRPLCNSLKKGM